MIVQWIGSTERDLEAVLFDLEECGDLRYRVTKGKRKTFTTCFAAVQQIHKLLSD